MWKSSLMRAALIQLLHLNGHSSTAGHHGDRRAPYPAQTKKNPLIDATKCAIA